MESIGDSEEEYFELVQVLQIILLELWVVNISLGKVDFV